MGWLSLLSTVLGLAKVLAQWMQERGLLSAGHAQAIVEGIDHAVAFCDDAKAGAAGMGVDTNDPDWRSKVHNKYKRP